MAYQDPPGSRSGRTSGRTTRRHRNRVSEPQTVYNTSTQQYERYKVSGYFEASRSTPRIVTSHAHQVKYTPPVGKGPNFKRKGGR